MNRFLKILILSIFAVFLCIGSAMALQLGTNITNSDTVNTGTGWYSDREDQEVEPNCVTGQQWDLEGFFLKGNTLTMVGGYELVNGEGFSRIYHPGDILIDIDGNAKYGVGTNGGYGNSEVTDTFDLFFLGDDIDNFIAHFTMEWGNDNLMGKTAPVPEPATMLLFGVGLIGVVGIGRKQLFKKQ